MSAVKMTHATQRTITVTYDVFIAHNPTEQALAERLRSDFAQVGLAVHPPTQAADAVLACGVLLILQAAPKLDEHTRALMALAQQPRYDRPLLTVYVQGTQLALWRVNNQPLYMQYSQGVAHVVVGLWERLQDARTQRALDILQESDDNALGRLVALAPPPPHSPNPSSS